MPRYIVCSLARTLHRTAAPHAQALHSTRSNSTAHLPAQAHCCATHTFFEQLRIAGASQSHRYGITYPRAAQSQPRGAAAQRPGHPPPARRTHRHGDGAEEHAPAARQQVQAARGLRQRAIGLQLLDQLQQPRPICRLGRSSAHSPRPGLRAAAAARARHPCAPGSTAGARRRRLCEAAVVRNSGGTSDPPVRLAWQRGPARRTLVPKMPLCFTQAVMSCSSSALAWTRPSGVCRRSGACGGKTESGLHAPKQARSRYALWRRRTCAGAAQTTARRHLALPACICLPRTPAARQSAAERSRRLKVPHALRARWQRTKGCGRRVGRLSASPGDADVCANAGRCITAPASL